MGQRIANENRRALSLDVIPFWDCPLKFSTTIMIESDLRYLLAHLLTALYLLHDARFGLCYKVRIEELGKLSLSQKVSTYKYSLCFLLPRGSYLSDVRTRFSGLPETPYLLLVRSIRFRWDPILLGWPSVYTPNLFRTLMFVWRTRTPQIRLAAARISVRSLLDSQSKRAQF